ncbi:proteasome endopeptidase complex, archaeal, beta subunit [Candidatus Bathyarchaeota archaeon RBG_13_60_20]|nr:MAG: proteasome endopeptidase complex, archaeal, beta subunit [Candidatus Bathyarchaeota archaeon RBG_13_60_20]
MSAETRILKGTTTIGVVCKDGVILGTDTRATMGTYVASKHAKKVYQITDNLAMTIAGGVAVAQKVVEILKVNSRLYELEKNRPIPVKSAARLVSNLLFQNREVGMPLPMQALVGGFDETGPHVFNLDPYGSLIEEKMVSTGSGSPFAYGVLETEFSEDSSIQEMLPVVVRAVDAAMKRDVASGDGFDVVVIDSSGFRELTLEEKQRVLVN